MATAKMTCRVCGKEYEGCKTLKVVPGVFRWKDVACTPECGAIYLERITKSRMKKPVTPEIDLGYIGNENDNCDSDEDLNN